MRSSGITAIIVTYNPDLSTIIKLLEIVQEQVESVVVVDNGSKKNIKEVCSYVSLKSIAFILNPCNYGIAKAHNQGIKYAKDIGSKFVLLLDQDSIPVDNMVKLLLKHYHSLLKQKNGLIAAMGAQQIDKRSQRQPAFIRLAGMMMRKTSVMEGADYCFADYIISSGSLIPMDAIDQIGYMDEDLFIDYVDIEWGLRARKKGYSCVGVFSAKLLHAIGDEPIKLLRGISISNHKPLRNYYYYRNAILLYKRGYIPFWWKVNDFIRLAANFFIYAIYAPRPLQHIKMMCLGVCHGVLSKTGKKASL